QGIADESQNAGCQTARRQLMTAGEVYFAQYDTQAIAGQGGANGAEQTLLDAGILSGNSAYYNVPSSGDLQQGLPCTWGGSWVKRRLVCVVPVAAGSGL